MTQSLCPDRSSPFEQSQGRAGVPLSGRRAALYCADTLQLLAQQQQLFVTRVPVLSMRQNEAVATMVAQPLTALGNGYHGRWQRELCTGVAQRWLLVRSEQASHREQQTLAKTCSKTVPASSKPSPNCADALLCEADAQAELSCFTASLMLLQLDAEVVGEPVYRTWQTKRGEEPIGHQFQITGLAATSLVCVEEARNQTRGVHPGDQ